MIASKWISAKPLQNLLVLTQVSRATQKHKSLKINSIAPFYYRKFSIISTVSKISMSQKQARPRTVIPANMHCFENKHGRCCSSNLKKTQRTVVLRQICRYQSTILFVKGIIEPETYFDYIEFSQNIRVSQNSWKF